MTQITEGSAVKCSICGKDTTVSFITDRQGKPAYDLGCYHRNAYCDACQMLVPDVSEAIQEVQAKCPVCHAEAA
ncbi:MAG: hypothetical protein ABI539_04765 [Acidobacteriota bacterium]